MKIDKILIYLIILVVVDAGSSLAWVFLPTDVIVTVFYIVIDLNLTLGIFMLMDILSCMKKNKNKDE